jgi:tRNA A22 N-methylase
MIQLDGRLSAVASLVRPGSRVADIGTDHGLLMVHLVQSGRSPGGFVCDLREKPLDAARRRWRSGTRTTHSADLRGTAWSPCGRGGE